MLGSEGELKKRIGDVTWAKLCYASEKERVIDIIDEAKQDFPWRLDENGEWVLKDHPDIYARDKHFDQLKEWYFKWFGDSK